MTACTFCQIAAGSVPAAMVLDEPEVLAFLDRAPVFPGHVLIIPRTHVPTLVDLDAGLVPTVFGAAQRVAAAVMSVLGADGTWVSMNNTVSQSVPHLHVHVVPRRRKDGLRGFYWPRQRYPSDDDMHDVAATLRAALA
jgi:histidine triad (HIT) family protein